MPNGVQFLARFTRVQGMTARIVERLASDLWVWGKAEGTLMASAPRRFFAEDRAKPLEHMRSFASFLAPQAREAMQRLQARLRDGGAADLRARRIPVEAVRPQR